MTVRKEDFYGGALAFQVTSDLTISAIARHINFWGASAGTFNVDLAAGLDFAKRMDHTWLGGPLCFVRNSSAATINFEVVVGGESFALQVTSGASAIVVAVDPLNNKPNSGLVDVSSTPDTKIATPSTGLHTVIEGIVHNGGSPGGTGCERLSMPTGSWSGGAASANNHGDAAGFSLMQALHLIGNNNGTTARQKHSRYRVNSWATLSDFGQEIQGGHGGAINDLGYIFCADAAAALASKPISLFDYRASTDSYSAKAGMPHPAERGGSAEVPAFDRIAIIRGDPLLQASWLYHQPSGTFEAIDFYSGATKRSMSCFAHYGKVMSVGGYNDTAATYFDTADAFNVATRAWSSGAALPAQRRDGAAIAWRSVGVYAGGEDNTATPTSTVYRMNATATWFLSTAKGSTNFRNSQQGGTAR